MEIISYESARDAGLVFYFTGIFCTNKHLSKRYVKTKTCFECHFLAVQKTSDKYRIRRLIKAALKANSAKLLYEESRESREKESNERNRIYREKWRKENAERSKVVNDIWRKNNHEKMTATTTAWRKENPQKVKIYSLRYSKNNKAKEIARSAARYAKNLESDKKKNKLWRLKNPELLRIYGQNYRAKKSMSGGRLSKGLPEKLYALQRGRCACCSKLLGNSYHMDHITPIKKGGMNVDSNIQLLTQRCNSQKNAKDPIEFMQSRGFLL